MVKFNDVKNVTTEEYFSKSGEFSINIWRTKYGTTAEEKDFPARTFQRIAKTAASYEKTDELRKYWEERWFSEMWEGYWRPAGSIIAALGVEGNQSISNCTTIELEEDNLESIFKTSYKVSKAAAYRQGLGVDVSKLRPRGTTLSNSAKISTGAIHWMSFIDSIGKYVGQFGRTPAFLLSISIKHPDVEEFITVKADRTLIQSANLSVQITDEFMRAYELDSLFVLEFHVPEHNETVSKTIRARDLMRKIAENAWEHAEPGVQFIDTCIKNSMTDTVGFPIKSTNACSEKFMHPDSTCVLGSLALRMFDFTNYHEKLKEIAESMVRFLDNTITYELEENKSPFENQKYVVSQLREIGCGLTDISGWLLRNGIGYDSEQGISKIVEFVRDYSTYAWSASIALGKEKGNAPAFQKMLDERGDNSFIYESAFARRMHNGAGIEFGSLRNLNVMSIAPTGTISEVFPFRCDSSGIEPPFGYYYWKRTKISGKWQYFFCIPSIVRERLLELGLADVPSSIEDPTGKIGKQWITEINKVFDPVVFKPAHKIDPLKKVEMMGRVAEWIDSSISVTYNLPQNATVEQVEKIYYTAWKQGVKSVSVYRDKSRKGVIDCDDVSYLKEDTNLGDDRPTHIEIHAGAVRPKELDCDIHRLTAKGVKLVVIVGKLENFPYEVFAAREEAVGDIPKSMTTGKVKKTGKGKYTLISELGDVIIPNLGDLINNEDYGDYTRMISTQLRHGVPVDFIVEQLEKTEGTIVSLGKGIMRVLKPYVGEYYKSAKGKKCANCGSESMEYKEGCFKCTECGSSKCG